MKKRFGNIWSVTPAVLIFFFTTSPLSATGFIKEGLYKYYLDNEIKGLEYYEDFERNGVFFEYYHSGEIKRMAWYRDGRPHGLAKVYSEDGHLLRAVMYLDGEVIKSYAINEAGQLIEK